MALRQTGTFQGVPIFMHDSFEEAAQDERKSVKLISTAAAARLHDYYVEAVKRKLALESSNAT